MDLKCVCKNAEDILAEILAEIPVKMPADISAEIHAKMPVKIYADPPAEALQLLIIPQHTAELFKVVL